MICSKLLVEFEGNMNLAEIKKTLEGKKNLLFLIKTYIDKDISQSNRVGLFISTQYKCPDKEEFYQDKKAFLMSIDK